MLPPTDEFEISPEALALLMNDPESTPFRLVDCREEDEHAICRIEGAELIPLSRFGEEAPRKLLQSDDSRPIIVYCHHGMRSLHATLFLRQHGKGETWSLAGGIDLWSRTIDASVPRY